MLMLEMSKIFIAVLAMQMLLPSAVLAETAGFLAHSGSTSAQDIAGDNARQKTDTAPELIRVGKICTTFEIFTWDNQLLSSHDEIFIGTRGTVLGSSDDERPLHVGRILIDTGTKPVCIATRVGKVTIAPATTALLEAPAHAPFRIRAVGGNEASTISLISYKGADPVTVKVGEELTVRSNIVKQQINLEQYWREEKHLSVSTALLSSALRKADGSRLVSHINAAAQKTGSGFDILSIAQSQEAAGSPQTNGLTFLYAATGTKFVQDSPGVITLLKGAFFLNNQSGATVKTDIGEVHSGENSLLSVAYMPGMLRVKACSGHGDIWLKVGKSKISLESGKEVLLADHHPSAHEAAPEDGIGRRQLLDRQINRDTTAVVGDFSMVSMIHNADYMRSIKRQADKTSKHLLDKLEKTAAAINIAQANRGRYFTYSANSEVLPDGLFQNSATMLSQRP